jgi:serine/threonine protein kinase
MYSENLRKPCPPFKWGTPGFMSPEQMAAATPTIYEDIFGLGALMIALFTGLSPDKMESSNYELILLELSNNYGNKRIIDLILRCHSIDTSERPSIKKIHEAIIQYLRDINAGTIE